MFLAVADAQAFIADVSSSVAMQNAIAAVAGPLVAPDDVEVTLSAARRLSFARRLQGAVQVAARVAVDDARSASGLSIAISAVDPGEILTAVAAALVDAGASVDVTRVDGVSTVAVELPGATSDSLFAGPSGMLIFTQPPQEVSSTSSVQTRISLSELVPEPSTDDDSDVRGDVRDEYAFSISNDSAQITVISFARGYSHGGSRLLVALYPAAGVMACLSRWHHVTF